MTDAEIRPLVTIYVPSGYATAEEFLKDCNFEAVEPSNIVTPRTKTGFDHDGILRVLGCRDGFLHALVLVEHVISRFHGQYRGHFHPRHTRKIRERDAITTPLREIAASLDKDMRACLSVYENNSAELKAAAGPATAVLWPKTPADTMSAEPASPITSGEVPQ